PKEDDHPVPAGVVSWNEVVRTRYTSKTVPKANIDLDKDIIILPYSSGTTGSPKGVMLSHRNFGMMMDIYIRQEATNIVPLIADDWDYEREKVMLFLPFYHAFGFGLLNVSLLQGATGILFKHFDPHPFCRAIQDHKVRLIIRSFLGKHLVHDVL
ncbi:unnamed protein product, partial [Strongylus vulgaris]